MAHLSYRPGLKSGRIYGEKIHGVQKVGNYQSTQTGVGPQTGRKHLLTYMSVIFKAVADVHATHPVSYGKGGGGGGGVTNGPVATVNPL